MPRRPSLLLLSLLTAACQRETAKRAEPAGGCRDCHAAIVDSYARTGMGRSFRAPREDDATVPYHHARSDTWFQLVARGGVLYQRRWQTGADADEQRVDYVMGSGNRVRTFLHRTVRNTLIELPLAWYAEGGPALNPGFDTAAPLTRRRLGYDCMFCHNANLRLTAESFAEPVFPAALPMGIDCERCHGPGDEHVRAARQAKPVPAELRRTIVNPAKLSPERSLEACMQCHLETTSRALPNVIRRFERGPFSYRVGEPLGEFAQFFDHAPGTGHEGKFEIVSSVYRLRQSACYLKSGGALTCVRCHDPHVPSGDASQKKRYDAACQSCHAGARKAGHPAATGDCASCHMPKRRAEDVVRAVMTDHRIGARPAVANGTAPIAEKHGAAVTYRGPVVAYYPAKADAAYLAAAQVLQQSNLTAGLEALRRLPADARWEFHVIQGDALRDARQAGEALAAYRRALAAKPFSTAVLRRVASVAAEAGEAERLLRQVTGLDSRDSAAWHDLALLLRQAKRTGEALEAARRAWSADPDSVEIATTLGSVLAESGQPAEAEKAFREALRVNPYSTEAGENLAGLLAAQGRGEEALAQFARVYAGASARGRYTYGVLLAGASRLKEAEREVRAALALDGRLAEAHHLLGGLMLQRDDTRGAAAAYREALRLSPAMAKAQLDLGMVLVAQGAVGEGVAWLERAAGSGDAAVRAEARQALASVRR